MNRLENLVKNIIKNVMIDKKYLSKKQLEWLEQESIKIKAHKHVKKDIV